MAFSGRSHSFPLRFGMLALAWLAFASPTLAQLTITADTLTDEHVRKAMDALVEELYERKHPRRFWEPQSWPQGISKTQNGGFSALAALALVYAGESYQNPRLRDAIEFIERFDMKGNYAVSLRAALWARLPDRFLPHLEKDIVYLLEGFNPEVGSWDYTARFRRNYSDNSIRQFGALALWEAAKRGGRISPDIWRSIEHHLIDVQLDNGAWNYTEHSSARGSMTTAGLATLFITQDYLHADEALRITNQTSLNQQAIDRGIAWLEKNFSATENPGTSANYFYYMYGVERVGLASGLKFFAGHDWFREGAAEIINQLCLWDPTARTMKANQKIYGRGNRLVRLQHLAFGLMFLSRGRPPVAINKLRVPGMAWNNRPRDVANLVEWISQRSESPVNWQIVDLDTNPEQWLDASVLYLASHEMLPWLGEENLSIKSYVRDMREYRTRRALGVLPPDTEAPITPGTPVVNKIKRYLDLGGLLLAMNESNARKFSQTVEQLGLIMYPQYEWRTLHSDHWAYRIHEPIRRRRPPLKALSNGVRELIILSPTGDLPRTLQGRDEKKDTHYRTLTNIYFYASEMDRPRPRLSIHALQRTNPSATTSSVTLVRAMYDGNYDPEPLAMEMLVGKLAEQRGIDVTLTERSLAGLIEIDPPPDFVMVSGVDRHDFTSDEREAIKAYVETGGMILFETVGGRGDFTLSAEEMATDLLGLEISSTLLTPIITGKNLEGAPDLTRLDYRPYSLIEAFGARETTPRLRCLRIEGEPRILFSREDLSQALLDQGVWGVSGYTSGSALNLMGNMIQYATSRNTDGE